MGEIINYKFLIYGQTPSKKSSQQVVRCKDGTTKVFPNKKYQQWKGSAIKQLKTQYSGAPIDDPIAVKATVYRWSLRRADLVNLVQSIHDILQDAGIIADDYFIESMDGSRKTLGVAKDSARVEIDISEYVR